jgi:hypothetical protein
MNEARSQFGREEERRVNVLAIVGKFYDAQSMEASSISAPLGLTNLQFGLVIGASAGLGARWRGRWI